MRIVTSLLLSTVLTACASAPAPEPDFSRPLGHYDDGHLHTIVLGAIDHGDAVEYHIHLGPAERPTTLLDAALIVADGAPVTPLEPPPTQASGTVRIRFPRTAGVTHVGVRYESPNGMRRTILVPLR